MAHNFVHRLVTGSKGPPTGAHRGIGKQRMASFRGMTSGSRVVSASPKAGRARVGPKTMQSTPFRKALQTKKIGSPRKAGAPSVSAKRLRQSSSFIRLIKRDR